jgi:hypothetical protein
MLAHIRRSHSLKEDESDMVALIDARHHNSPPQQAPFEHGSAALQE